MDKIYNFIHNDVIFRLYAWRNKIFDRPVWLSYTKNDIIKKSRIILDKLDIREDDYILDIGVGNGMFLEPFYAVTKNIFGIDKIKQNIKQCRERFPSIPSDNFTWGDAIQYLWSNYKKYNVIIMSGVLGYFTPKDQINLIQDCIERLQPGGYLVISGLQMRGDHYLWQTYTQEKAYIYMLGNYDIDVYNEWKLYGIEKYSKCQRTIIIKI